MARHLAELRQINEFLLKINLYQTEKNRDSFLPGEDGDLRYIPELISLITKEIANFSPDGLNLAFKSALFEFFAARWDRIANTPLCYTRNPSHPLNQVCIRLATLSNPGKRNSLLMPTLPESDIFGYELNHLEMREFIIADNKQQFITLEGLVHSACERILERNEHIYVTANQQGRTRPLSATELQRCGKLIPTINSIAKWYGTHQGNCLRLLTTLRDCLLSGDAGHGGEEFNAGSDANVGLANFSEFYNAMSAEARQQLCDFRDGGYSIGTVLERLFRPTYANYREARYCIQSLGRILEGIINVNSGALSGLPISQHQNLRCLIRIVKQQLSGYDLSASSENSTRLPNVRERSCLNPSLTYNENEYVVSLITIKGSFSMPTAAKIIVEGVKNGRVFVGSYYVTAKSGTGWPFLSDQIQNTPGVFTKVKVFESYGYAQIPQTDADGNLVIEPNGDVVFKFDQPEELRRSLSRSYQVPVENIVDMINSIKQDAAATEFAYWIYGHTNLTTQQITTILGNSRLSSLFIPYEPFGKYSFFGHGKNNGITWCEEKLTLAGCGQRSAMDGIKAKPIMHVTW